MAVKLSIQKQRNVKIIDFNQEQYVFYEALIEKNHNFYSITIIREGAV